MNRARWFLVLTLTAAAVAAQAPAPPAQGSAQPAVLPSTPASRPAEPVSMVVIDPAHGGADSGARGAAGILEKDVTLHFALLLRDQLQRQGFRAVLTRYGSESPTYDDRAAAANSYRGAVYISLHAASTGPVETARCYFDSLPPAAGDAAPATIPVWERAQEPYIEASRRLGSLIQVQLKE